MFLLTILGGLCLSILLRSVAALPNGCSGSVGIMEIKSPKFSQLVWTCANINPGSIFGSGQNFLIATHTTSDDQTCGNQCAALIGVPNVEAPMAAIRYYESDRCECWQVGFIEIWNLTPPTSKAYNGTFIDFFDIGSILPRLHKTGGFSPARKDRNLKPTHMI